VLDLSRGHAFLAIAMVQTERLRPSFLPAMMGQGFIEQDATGGHDGVLVVPTAGPVRRLRRPHLERQPISHGNSRCVFRPVDLRDRHLWDLVGECLGLKAQKKSLHKASATHVFLAS
jgi:hypothetical protein